MALAARYRRKDSPEKGAFSELYVAANKFNLSNIFRATLSRLLLYLIIQTFSFPDDLLFISFYSKQNSEYLCISNMQTRALYHR